MFMTCDEFRELCLKHFRFLVTEFACEASFPESDPILPEWLRGYVVHFKNSTTRVSITLEVIERLPTVHLHRLDAGSDERNVFALGLLLLIRAPHLNPLKEEAGLPLKKDIETLLVEYAHALKVTAADVLGGDFTVFPALLEEWVRQSELRANPKRAQFKYF
jgi:hypothetical protein